jgi:general stress protein 26
VQARDGLENAEVYWLSTVRPDGRLHIRPMAAVWQDGALHFAEGPSLVKAKNLTRNARCAMMIGRNSPPTGWTWLWKATPCW